MQFIWTHVFPFINSFRPAWFHNAPFFFLIRHFSAPGPSWTSISAVESSGTACAMCKCYLVKYVWHMLDAVLFHTIQKYVHCAMYRYTFSLRRDQNIGAVDVSIWNLPKLKIISDRGVSILHFYGTMVLFIQWTWISKVQHHFVHLVISYVELL